MPSPKPGPGTHVRSMGALRRANEARCALALRAACSATVTGLARLTALSRPTVEAALVGLRDRGIVAEDTTAAETAGRPARRYRFAGEAAVVAGVNVSGTRAQVMVANLAGTILAEESHSTGTLRGMDRLNAVKSAITSALAQGDIQRTRLASVALAVTGVVGPHGRLTVSHHLPDWEGMDIAGRLQERLGSPVQLGNDVNLAAVAEHRLGAAQLADDLVYLLLGPYISAGLVLGGRLRLGSHHAAGELSRSTLSRHFPFDENGTIVWSSAPDAVGTFRLAGAGDERAGAEVTRFCAALAETLISFGQLIDPDCIVLGGWAAELGDDLLGPLRHAMHPYSSTGLEPIVLTSALGNDSVVLGALAHAFDVVAERFYGIPDVPLPALHAPDGSAVGKPERIRSG